MIFCDTHAHMDDQSFSKDRNDILTRLKEDNLAFIISIGYDIDSSENCIDQAKKYKNIYAVVGIHPHEAKLMDENSITLLERMSRQKEVVGIGETGLDYYRLLSNKTQQNRAFHVHMNIALSQSKPVVIHDREAHNEIIKVLEDYKSKVTGVIHAFSGDVDMAKKVLDLGYYISICGWVTYKKAEKTKEVVSFVPEDRLLVETDSPYLAPVPHRGKRNQPAYVLHTINKIAEIRHSTPEHISEITLQNARKCFSI